MTTPKDKLKPVKCATNYSPPTDWPPRVLAAKRPIVYRLRRATDWFAVFGLGSAVVAFLLWAWPWDDGICVWSISCWLSFSFSLERLPAVVAFLILSFILLLLRRR